MKHTINKDLRMLNKRIRELEKENLENKQLVKDILTGKLCNSIKDCILISRSTQPAITIKLPYTVIKNCYITQHISFKDKLKFCYNYLIGRI